MSGRAPTDDRARTPARPRRSPASQPRRAPSPRAGRADRPEPAPHGTERGGAPVGHRPAPAAPHREPRRGRTQSAFANVPRYSSITFGSDSSSRPVPV